MTEDANWIGVTPKPPASCDKTGACTATIHQVGCQRAKAHVNQSITNCEALGQHQIVHLLDGIEPVRLVCRGCRKNWEVIPL